MNTNQTTPQQELDALVSLDKFEFLKHIENWCNHRPLLYLGLSLTSGTVIELGSGYGSTPFLKRYCEGFEREFVTYESNADWAEKSGSTYVEDWDKADIWNKSYGLAFVDHAPGEHRYKAIAMLVNKSDIIVVHDSEEGGAGDYKLDKIWGLFKYRLNYNKTGGGAGATILSNKVDVSIYDKCSLAGFLFEK